MKNFIALALVAASLTAFPVATPAFAVDTSISALCGPDGPESYKRPGGYCEQIGSNNSLVEPKDGCTYYYLPASIDLLKPLEETALVADNCYYYQDAAPAETL
ncbi:hypothetical protein [Devosia sp. CN2-171]|jgi:hypothetical protein|uniref:hypothetical protein n=1 Tax=Devosia sp. CN2-171 TaxID=3400909 RepID=UPI003BF9103F